MKLTSAFMRVMALALIGALAACNDTNSSDAGAATASATATTGITNTVESTDSASIVRLSAQSYEVPAHSNTAVFVVERQGNQPGSVVVGYSTVNGSATSGADFTAMRGWLTWADGDLSPRTITVPIESGAGGKSFGVTLTSVTGTAALGSPSSATVSVAPVSSSSAAAGSTSSSSSSSGGQTTVSASSSSTSSSSSGASSTVTASNSSSGGSSSSGAAPVTNAYYVAPGGTDSNSGDADAPFASFAKAQAAMQSSAVKTTYVRAGTYANVAVTLTAADNGETWSFYPSDGYNSAILDGGASSSSNGGNPFTIDGASSVTVNGLLMQNAKNCGICVHGGQADSDAGFPNSVATATGDTIENNIVRNVFTATGRNGGWGGAGIWIDGLVPTLTISHNVVTNTQGMGIGFYGNFFGSYYYGNLSGYNVTGNAVFQVCQSIGDCGAIYTQDLTFGSTNIAISNNFVRDYQCDPSGGCASNGNATRNVCIYLDIGSSNETVTGNICGNTSNTFRGSSALINTTAYFVSSGHNDVFEYNLVDLGTSASILNAQFESFYPQPGETHPEPAMTGNVISHNIYVGNWSGAQDTFGAGQGPYAYPDGYVAGGSTPAAPTIGPNLYYNYGPGSLNTRGPDFSDSAPVTTVNPLVSGDTLYSIGAGSPGYGSPINFPLIVGGYGPPGFIVPTGTAPSP